MRFVFIFLSLLLIHLSSFPQFLSTLRTRNAELVSDTIFADSLQIVPGSLKLLTTAGEYISENDYFFDEKISSVIISPKLRAQFSDVTLIYRVFPYDFRKSVFNKDTTLIIRHIEDVKTAYTFKSDGKSNFQFGSDELIRQGSISRSVSFGNNQDVVVNSNLNMQLSGKLGRNLNITAAITDNNIPIQPEGNTQQIQDFDKVFITLYNETFRLTVGDFELTKPPGEFMQMNRKAQGFHVLNVFRSDKDKNKHFKTSASGSVSKGKYFRLNFAGTEGVQGPYKLKGAMNEPYIIIIAGSERIYIDGKLLERGLDYDYVIDYNTAELTFTVKQPITKDKRIIAEYEYTDKNYVRFMLFSGNEWKTGKNLYWLNVFSESDSKSQTLQQPLSENEKRTLVNAGNNLENMYVPFYTLDTVPNSEFVYYKMTDTIVDIILYDSIFVFSTNPDSAKYRVGFTYMGAGRGNYVQTAGSINGRVFKWVAPVNNIKQGDYEPLRFLAAPQTKNVINTGAVVKLASGFAVTTELGYSYNDKNTLSEIDDEKNSGLACRTELGKAFSLGDTSKNKLFSAVYFRVVDGRFDPVERYRSAEFERDWNLTASNLQQNEIMSGLKLTFNRKGVFSTGYMFDFMNRENSFSGNKHTLSGSSKWKGFKLNGNASYLTSGDVLKTTEFLRHRVLFQKEIRKFVAGVSEEQEINYWRKLKSDTLYSNSFSYNQFEVFTGINDSLKKSFILNYKQRREFLPENTRLKYTTNSKDFGTTILLQGNRNNILKTELNYRILDIIDTNLTSLPRENNLTGRLEHSLKVLKSFLFVNTIYETGSGIETKKEFVYIEVPAGQGVYTWTDYNGNGLKELNEFETAMFADQATYIRVFTPTSEYIKVFTGRFTQVINIRPETLWGNKKGFTKIVSLFSNQTAYNFENKHSAAGLEYRINPFPGLIPDSLMLLVNRNIRNTLSYNKNGNVFGIDYLFQDNMGSTLLINGIDERSYRVNTIRLRWNISRYISIINSVSGGFKSLSSEYFPSKNYRLDIKAAEASLSYQPSVTLRFTASGKYNHKINISGTENSEMAGAGIEIKYNVVQKGDVSVKTDFIKINYDGATTSAVAYEMLEGLQEGNNAVWSVQYQRSLSNTLQLSVMYNGRASEGAKTVHIGTVQVRAYF